MLNLVEIKIAMYKQDYSEKPNYFLKRQKKTPQFLEEFLI
jgi:hypothetical protein